MQKFQKLNTPDRILGQIQDNVARVVDPLQKVPLNQGLLLENVALLSGDNVINHRLGRALIGWFITRQRSSAAVYDKQDLNRTPNLNLVLNASADVNIDLWVF